MKDWEDIFRESLEDCSDSLPEGSLEEFQRKISSPRRQHRLAWLAVPAAAACAALAFLLPHRGAVETVRDSVARVEESVVPISPAEDTCRQEETSGVETLVSGRIPAQTLNLIAQAHEVAGNTIPARTETAECAPESSDIAGAGDDAPQEAGAMESHDAGEMSPVVPQDRIVTWTGQDKSSARRRGTGVVLKAGGGVLGGAGAGLLACLASGAVLNDDGEMFAEMGPGPRPGLLLSSANSEIRRKDLIPFKAGVTARYPLTERLYLMSGVEYSLYNSTVERFMTGKKHQYAHYVGIPVRLDWSVLKRKSLDLYMGAGASADWCVGAEYAGKTVRKDGLSVSLIAAGGALLKFNSLVGIYLEPQLAWTPGAASSMPRTYRTEHTLVPCVATGVRFTICEK